MGNLCTKSTSASNQTSDSNQRNDNFNAGVDNNAGDVVTNVLVDIERDVQDIADIKVISEDVETGNGKNFAETADVSKENMVPVVETAEVSKENMAPTKKKKNKKKNKKHHAGVKHGEGKHSRSNSLTQPLSERAL